MDAGSVVVPWVQGVGIFEGRLLLEGRVKGDTGDTEHLVRSDHHPSRLTQSHFIDNANPSEDNSSEGCITEGMK